MDKDTNEGLIGDTLHRLVFGRPATRSRLIRAGTRDGAPLAGPVLPGQSYISMTLATQGLASKRVLSTRFRPVFYAQAAIGQDLMRPIQVAALVLDPKDAVGGEGAGKLSSEGVVTGDRPLFVQTPYHGRLETQLSLLACRSEALLKTLLPLGEDIRRSLGGASDDASGGGIVASARGALRSVMPGSLALDLASATARAFMRMDGDWTPRFEYSGVIPNLAPGHYVLLAMKSDAEPEPKVEYDASTRILYLNGQAAQKRDYAVLRIDATDRRENIADLPDLGEAFSAIDLVYSSGGDTGVAVEKFRRLAMTSPFLIDKDRRELIDRVVRRVEMLKAAIEDPAERNESVLSSLTLGRGLGDLKSLWKIAPKVLDGIRRVSERIGSAMPAPTQPEPGIVATAPAPAPEAPGPDAGTNPATPPSPSPTDARFKSALAFTLRWEGGFSDEKHDRGGRTMQGVTERAFHAWLADQGLPLRPVESIRPDELSEIYRTNYWRAARCDMISQPVDQCQFDAAVNHGPGGAARLLQKALNRTFRDMRLETQVKEDGVVGPETLRQLARVDADILSGHYLQERRALYERIVQKNPEQQRFLRGWMNRVADLDRAISRNESVGLSEAVTPENTAFAGYVE